VLRDGWVDLGPGLPYAARWTLRDVDAPRLAAALAGHDRYQGRVSARADLAGELVDWRRSSGTIDLERAELRAGEVSLSSTAPARLALTRGWLSMARVGVAGPRLRLSLTGGLGLRDPTGPERPTIELGVDGRVDLELLELTSPSVEKAGGSLALEASLIGPLSSSTLVGTGRVEGGLLEWRGIESRVTGLAADLVFSDASVRVQDASARWAGGQLFGSGSLQLLGFAPGAYEATVRAVGVRPRFAFSKVELGGTLDGEVRVTGTAARLSMRGDLRVRRGRVAPKLDLASLVGSRRGVDVYDPSRETVDFDLGFSGDEPLQVKNGDLEVEMKGEVRLTGTNERFGMLGGATVLRGGRVNFLGRGYLMEGGTVEFRDRYHWEPRYDLQLATDACGVRIRLNLVGTLEGVQTLFGGNADMDEQDIVSCLVRGVRTRDLDQDLASFASNALLKLSGVDREVKKVIPVDQLDVTSGYSSQARAYEPRVQVAKELVLLDRSARLEYSTSLLRTDDQRAAIRMRLAPRLNLQLGWTSSEDVPFGDWGVDLERRWEW
jgi:hypothetical protein